MPYRRRVAVGGEGPRGPRGSRHGAPGRSLSVEDHCHHHHHHMDRGVQVRTIGRKRHGRFSSDKSDCVLEEGNTWGGKVPRSGSHEEASSLQNPGQTRRTYHPTESGSSNCVGKSNNCENEHKEGNDVGKDVARVETHMSGLRGRWNIHTRQHCHDKATDRSQDER